MKRVTLLLMAGILLLTCAACGAETYAPAPSDTVSLVYAGNRAVPEPTEPGPTALPVSEDFAVFRQPEEITVYPFTPEELEAARVIAENAVREMEEETGVLHFQAERLAFDPMLTDIHVRQKIAAFQTPGWTEADYYERYISFTLIYSASYDHNATFLPDAEHSAIGIHLYRGNDLDPWKVESTGVPVAEHSDAIMDRQELAEFGADVLAGYRAEADYWLYRLDSETGQAAFEIQPIPAGEESAPSPGETVPEETEGKAVLPESVPQSGEPIRPQPGDTTATWDPAKAAGYPADGDCTALELLKKWMTVEGLDYADLEERDCEQLILVVARETDGAETYTTCYQRQSDGAWSAVDGLTWMNGHTGSNGISHNRKRNTNTSPAGLWAMGTAFGNAEKPSGIKMPWRDVTPNSDWVCDANSVYFNTWQERDDPALAESWDYGDVEHLEDYASAYAYACVIRYNTPPYTVPDRGCAIFLHCSKGTTGGCIGLPEGDMVNTLRWLDPECNPHILITGYQKNGE